MVQTPTDPTTQIPAPMTPPAIKPQTPTPTPLPVGGAPAVAPATPAGSNQTLPVQTPQTYNPASPYAQPNAPANLPTSTGTLQTDTSGKVGAADAAASNDYFATHNSDGSPRQPWQGGPPRALQANDPGTDTLNRALGVTPGQALGLDADGKQITPNALKTDPTTGLPLSSEIARYNTPDQIGAISGTAPSSNPNLTAALPVGGGATGTPLGTSQTLPVQTAANPATSAAPAPAQSATPANGATASSGALPVSPAAPSGPGGVTLGNQDLTGATLSVGPTADRNQIVKDQISQYAKDQLPQLQAAIRGQTQQAAGLGRVGSGMLRTDVGNLDLAAENNLNSKFADLTSNAANASIGDAFNNVGIAQQQQGRQDSQQQTAFSQQAVQLQIQEALRQGDFNRAATLLQLGNAGNPSDTALGLSNSYGNQATAAGQGAAGLISGAVNANSQRDILNAILAGQGGGGASGGGSGGLDIEAIIKLLTGGGGGTLPPVQNTTNNTLPVGVPTGPIHQPAYPGG